MIVRDEAERLEACLAAARRWVDEICIVDTGSTDDTAAIAARMGAKVEHFDWCDDFSKARNASLEMATETWILVIDADETLTLAGGAALRQAILDPNAQAWLVYQDNLDEKGRIHPLALPRLFRNRPEIRFQRPAHETVMPSLRKLGVANPDVSDVRLHHVGYLPEVVAMKDENSRTTKALTQRASHEGGELGRLYQLATSLQAPQKRAEQLDAWDQAFALAQELPRAARREHAFLALLYDGCADALVQDGDLTGALRVITRALRDLPNAVELIWRRGDIAYRVGDTEAAGRYFRACFRPRLVDGRYDTEPRSRTVRPAVGLARLAIDNGSIDEATRHVQRALGFDSDYYPAHCLSIRASIVMGDGEAANERLASLLADAPDSPALRLLAGELAWMRRDRDAAAEFWADSDARIPAGHTSLCWLAITDAAEARFEDASARLVDIHDRDLSSAAARLLVSVITGTPYSRSNALRSPRLLKRVISWLRELLAIEADEALDRFAHNAKHYRAEVPGIEAILERDDRATAHA